MNQVPRQAVWVIGAIAVVAVVLLILLLDANGRASMNADEAATQAARVEAADATATENVAQIDALQAEATTALETAEAQQQAMLDAAAQRRDEAEAAAQSTQAALEAEVEAAVAQATGSAATATQAIELVATSMAERDAAQEAAVTQAFVEGMDVALGTQLPAFTQIAYAAAATQEAIQVTVAAQANELATQGARATAQFEFMNNVIGPSATAVNFKLMTQQAKVEALQTEVASNYIPLYPTVVLVYETPTPGGGVEAVIVPSPTATPTPVMGQPSPTFVLSPTPLPTFTVTPVGPIRTPAAMFALAASPYTHPSGYFEITPPANWELTETEDNPYSAYWVNQGARIVVHAFVVRFDAPVMADQAIAYMRDEYASGLKAYDAYTVIEERLGDPMIADIALSYAGQNYRATQWVTITGNLLAYLRIVVPEEQADLLDPFGIALYTTYRYYPDLTEGTDTSATPPAPAAGPAGIVISNLGGIGHIEEEHVEINNTDGTINLENWTLCGENDDDCYTFPRFVLFPRGSVAVYTRAGEDTPVALYWGREEPAWDAGETITLRDAEGNIQAERVAALGMP